MPTVAGAWTAELSGGCPKHETWHANPQFQVHPTTAGSGSTYAIELAQHARPAAEIGLWVMAGDNAAGRKTALTGMVGKSKFKATERRTIELALPPLEGGLPYIVVVSTFSPGVFGGFSLTVSSIEDVGVRIVPLQAEPPPPPALYPARAGAGSALGTVQGAIPEGSGHAPAASLGEFNPRKPAKAEAPASAAAEMVGEFNAGSTAGAPSNAAVVETLGSGLSSRAQAQAAALVEAALEASAASGGLYCDPDFPAAARSLGQVDAEVASWKRPADIAYAQGVDMTHAGAPLFKSDWEAGGVALGALHDEWLLGALNVVGGAYEVAQNLFVDASHAAQGFFVVRLWAEDPNASDDWQVVLVDDRLPCGPDGAPCFGTVAAPGAYWASIVEKAVAKSRGS